MIIFWMLYTLFFCIPFPIFIYMTSIENPLEPKNSLETSHIYLGISLVIWLYVLVFFIYSLFIETIKSKNRINTIMERGIPRDAKVIDYKLMKYSAKSNTNFIQIVLAFANLRNVQIEHVMFFNDIKPEEKRFEAGKTVKVLLNPNPLQEPYFILKIQKTKYNKIGMTLRVIFMLFLLTYIPALYYYFYTTESFNFGWRFLTFMHPIIFSGIMFLAIILVYQLIIKSVFFKNKNERILFAGRNAQADIISVSQTGLIINGQPEVLFQVSFKDFKGKAHIATYRKVIYLLDIASVPKHRKIEVMYDENNPGKIIIPKVSAESSTIVT